MSCIFGPVPSRRLGRSLGIDLVPFKTCCYDCVYCQIGRTPRCTIERRQWLPAADILRELEPRLSSAPDYITMGGSGEPTLYAGLDDLIAGIKSLTDIPVAVITNGALLWRADVRGELLPADLVAPSLDAGDAATFQRINRPAPEIDFERMAQGLVDFRRDYHRQYWLEIFLVQGLNDGPESLAALQDWAARIAPDRVQLNTVARPPADAGMLPVPPGRLQEIARRFRPPAEVIADYRQAEAPAARTAAAAEILAMLQRHPGTAEDVAAGLGIALAVAVRQLEKMRQDGQVLTRECEGRRFYMAPGGNGYA